MILNLLTSGELIVGSVVSWVQLIIVSLLLFVRKYNFALVLHFIFFVSSVNFSFVEIGSVDEFSSNYSKIKLFGYLPVSFLVLIWLGIGYKKNIGIDYFMNFLNQYGLLVVIASLTGFWGVLFSSYSIEYFIYYLYYSVSVFLFLYIFSKAINFKNFYFFKNLVVFSLIASGFTSILMFFFGRISTYGGISIIPYNSLFIFTPLILLVSTPLNSIFKILSLAAIGFVSVYSIGGKGVAFLVLVLIIYFFVNSKGIFKIIYPLFLIIIIVGLQLFFGPQSFESRNDLLSFHKFGQLFSIFNLNFSDSDFLDGVSDSPKVRIMEVINIVYMYIERPILSIFGLGFGAGFRDYSGLFQLVDLSKGAFDDSQINKGVFYRPHDTIPVVLLLHGLLGLLFILYWSIYFIVKQKNSTLLLGGIPWLFLTYGFDLNIAFFGCLCVVLGFMELGFNRAINVN